MSSGAQIGASVELAALGATTLRQQLTTGEHLASHVAPATHAVSQTN